MFYNKFKCLCDKVGLSCNRVAQSVGLSNSTVTKWKKGAVPHGETLYKIADYFGVSVGYLLGEEEQKEKPASETLGLKDELDKEFVELYGKLTPEQRKMFLAQMRGVVESQ